MPSKDVLSCARNVLLTWVVIASVLNAIGCVGSTPVSGADASGDITRERDVGQRSLVDRGRETPDDTANDADRSQADREPEISVADTEGGRQWADLSEADARDLEGTTDEVDRIFCDEKLRVFYVMDKVKALYRFDPDALTFEWVGAVDCDEFLDTTPASMAVSRLGQAYVNYSDSSLQVVRTEDGSCMPTAWMAGTADFGRFGMGYVSDGVRDEVLYVANADTLASLDPESWSITTIGVLPGQCELTGKR